MGHTDPGNAHDIRLRETEQLLRILLHEFRVEGPAMMSLIDLFRLIVSDDPSNEKKQPPGE
jgi:hypothetical protein